MSDDFKLLPNITDKQLRHMTLNHINDTLHSMGRDINEFALISEIFLGSSTAREAKSCHFERNIIVTHEDLILQIKLNIDQQKAYDVILDRIFKNRSRAFFVDVLDGTGKTFWYRAL